MKSREMGVCSAMKYFQDFWFCAAEGMQISCFWSFFGNNNTEVSLLLWLIDWLIDWYLFATIGVEPHLVKGNIYEINHWSSSG